MALKHKSIETKHYEELTTFYRNLARIGMVSRRDFFRIASLSAGIAATKGLVTPHGFELIEVVQAAETPPFRIAYISDTHMYVRGVNDRFVRSTLKAVDDVNALDPQPDFVLFGGDLAQLGHRTELDLGAEILKTLKAPVKMMVGEHDWFLDLGDHWQSLFGSTQYSFDHKDIHFIVLMSVNERDFWTDRGISPEERMQIVAGLDNPLQSRFEVGDAGREWLKNDLARFDNHQPVVIFSHSPLYKYYRNWNFWTEDADQVQAILARFDNVTVIHGHTHQLLMNRIGNINFYGMLSTAWPWPYAPEGLPVLTVQMNRADPFNAFDACGDGQFELLTNGTVNILHNLWNRNPVTVRASYLASNGTRDRPPATTLPSY
jgi:3',5'-cyclic-AMP phosphodiesterase